MTTRLDMFEKVWSAATKGPYKHDSWTVEAPDGKPVCHTASMLFHFRTEEQAGADGAFLALSWEAVRDLLAVAEAAAECDEAEQRWREFVESGMAASVGLTRGELTEQRAVRVARLKLHDALAPLLEEVAS